MTEEMLKQEMKTWGLENSPVCLHSSLGAVKERIDGGADALIESFLDLGCTVMTPTFSYAHMVEDQDDKEAEFYLESLEIDSEMGIIPRTLLHREDHLRGNHPLDSFSAVGPLAKELIQGQTPQDIYAPLKELIRQDGHVCLLGVGLDRLTLLHHCEYLAGRRLFTRFARVRGKGELPVLIGECSAGFPRLMNSLEGCFKTYSLGQAQVLVGKAAEIIKPAVNTMVENPDITRCSQECQLCEQAIGSQIK